MPRNALQIRNDFLQYGRGQLDRLGDGLLKSQNPLSHVLDLMKVVQPRGLLSHLCKAYLRDPDQMEMGPGSNSSRGTVTRAQEKLAQPVTSSQLILLRSFTRTRG